MPLAHRLALGRKADRRRLAAGPARSGRGHRARRARSSPSARCAISRWVVAPHRGQASRAGNRPPGRGRGRRGHALRPAWFLAIRRHSPGPGSPPLAQLGRNGAHLEAPNLATRPRGDAGRLAAVSIALASQARSQAGSPHGPLSEAALPTYRSILATPRSNGARRCWSSPASRARPGRGDPGRRGPGPRSQPDGMTRSLEDPTFAGHVESVETDLAYRVEFAGQEHRDVSRSRLRIPELSAPTPSWSSRAIRRSSPRPSRTSATSRPWRGPS